MTRTTKTTSSQMEHHLALRRMAWRVCGAVHRCRKTYDHRGRMVSKRITENAATNSPFSILHSTFVWDDWNIIREVVHTNSFGIRHSAFCIDNVWGLDLNGTLQGAGGVGGLLAVIKSDCVATNSSLVTRSSSLYLPTYDANGNVSEYVTTNGEVVAHYDYSPFGETLIESGPLADSFTHRFSTKPWCPVTGLYEYQMRKYWPEIGKRMSRAFVFSAEASTPDLSLYNTRRATINDMAYDYVYGGKKLATTHFEMPFKNYKESKCGYCLKASLSIEVTIYVQYFIDPYDQQYEKVRIHELHHVAGAHAAASAMEHVIGELDFGKCVTYSCLKAKRRYVEAIHELIVTQYDLNQATFDCMEYGGKCRQIRDFLHKVQMAGQKASFAKTVMDRRCK